MLSMGVVVSNGLLSDWMKILPSDWLKLCVKPDASWAKRLNTGIGGGTTLTRGLRTITLIKAARHVANNRTKITNHTTSMRFCFSKYFVFCFFFFHLYLCPFIF